MAVRRETMYDLAMANVTNSIVIPPDLDRRIRDLAGATGENRDSLVLRALEEFLSDVDDLKLAEERLEALRAGRSGTVTLEELMARHAMAD